MELHTLTLAAIGPFAGEHHIDFDAVGAGGLFLLEGPTGAGKSTLIDAIVFALYGDVAADGASKDRIPSTFAAGRKPLVRLTFSVPSGIYRIERSPEYQRPKARGTGMTTEKATARLVRLSDPAEQGGVHLASGGQAVGHELTALLGLTKAQFTQTVVLPQGQFATFLKAAPEDRRTILQDIFGTELYEQVQAELRQRSRDADRAIDTARTHLLAATTSLVTAVEVDQTTAAAMTAAAGDLDLPQLTALLEQLCDQVQIQRDTAAARAVSDHQLAAAADTALNQANDLAAAQAEYRQVQARQAELTDRRDQINRLRTDLAQADRAAGAAARCREAAGAEVTAAQTAGQLAAIRAGLASTDRDLAELGDPDQLLAAAAQADQQRGALAAAEELEKVLAQREQAVMATGGQLQARAAALDEREAAILARTKQRAELLARRAQVHTAAAEHTAAQLALSEANRIAQAAGRSAELAEKLATARRVETQLRAQATQAADQAAAVRVAWLSGLAGTLAADLVAEQPCPVCGATDHPAPAPLPATAATSEQAEAAQVARETAHDAVRTAEQESNLLASQLEIARAQADGLDPATSGARCAAAVARDTAAAAAVAELDRLSAQLEAFDQHSAAATEALAGDRAQYAADQAALVAATAALAADHVLVTAARGGHPSVAAASQRYRHRADQARALAQAHQQAATAAADATRLAKVAAAELAAAGFASDQAALAADLSAAQREAALAQITAFDQAQAAVTARLTNPVLLEAAAAEVPDIAAIEQQAMVAAANRDRSRAAAGAANSLAQTASRLAQAVTAAMSQQLSLAASVGPIRRLAELATAGPRNTAQLTLATFVLLRRFEEVIDHANARLQTMSAGRYQLRRASGREGGMRSRRTGLGLDIVDHFAGDTARNPHTLSGGETFIVSLCLALGLADAVTSQAGGIDMKTLFIDEGFGTLDAETLDTVMAELDRLRDGGRIVGVVSHVAELKSRIAERISVRPLANGAATLTVIAR